MSAVAVGRSRAEIARHHAKAPVVLVPTMGGLHAGHLALVKKARQLADKLGGAKVCVSIFVNPLQFGPSEDFAIYPRRLEADVAALAGYADTCFAPSAEAMYPQPQQVFVTAPALGAQLCGASRPGFFDGVLTVVMKLYELLRPTTMVFGEKDYQQLVLVRQMLRQLNTTVRIEAHPVVREADGLALSSRNERLGPKLRKVAPALAERLGAAAAAIKGGASAAEACADAREALAAAGFAVDYVECRALDLVGEHARDAFVVLGAATLGDVRLIDNVIVRS